MPFVSITETPLVPGISPVELYYRELGHGRPLIFLHGGWGYQVYPFDRQIAEFGAGLRIIIPDRSGYGQSSRIESLPPDFHRRAALETLSLIDALKLDRPVLWGHSDGAVIAALLALSHPSRLGGVILEAFHFLRQKPGSRDFFATMAGDPRLLGERITEVLARDHGEDYWEKLILMNGSAWLAIADEATKPDEDLYDGRLGELRSRAVPHILIHGSRDPRTEPGELDAVAEALGRDRIRLVPDGGHSPHSASASFERTNQIAREFLQYRER
jgi:pimeloyl-ACP methyl ester carboxylesterase